MSSPLDGRIRAIAREEAAALVGAPSEAQAAAGSEPTAAQLQQQIKDLHEHLHHAATTIKHLEDRVDTLEKTAAAPAPRRASRKAGSPENGE